MAKYIKALLILLVFTITSCNNEYNFYGETEQKLQFDASPIEYTKGVPLQFNDPIPTLGVFGYNTGVGQDGKWKGTESPQYIQHLLVTNQNDSWIPNERKSWPKEVGANVSFFAYSPYTSAKNGITVNAPNGIDKIVGIPTINYTVPSTCEDQPDLMVSTPIKDYNVVQNGNSPIRFEMHHALTSIGFNGTGVGLIEKLTVDGVKTTGTLTTDESGKATWGNLSGNGTLIVKTNMQVSLNNKPQALNTSDGYLMMIPQELQPGAKLTVTLVGGKTIEFPLQGKWEANKKVYYNLNLFDLKLTNTVPQFNTYIGAFWKSNQIGERIISVPFNTIPNAKTNGLWKAYVIFKDNKWAENDICFSSTPSKDTNLFSENTVDMNTRDGDFTVSDGTPSIVGTMNSTSPIYFRIGLRSTYTSTTENPARYAVVALVYQQNDKFNYHFIYLRQGEQPDYIMRTSESDNKYSDTPTRNYARKFAAYNLTGNIDARLAINGATFTSYPSQSGALFQWANFQDSYYRSYQNYAFNPSYGSTYSSWPIKIQLARDSRYSFWYYYGQYFNISPVGFKRPQDGTVTGSIINNDNYSEGYESYDVDGVISSSNSEFKQSLMNNLNSTATNAVFGYYADGFFDRRAIDPNNCVAAGSAQVASIGKLFYNPKTYASVFFPTAGYREGQSGQLTSGSLGRYWSSCGYLSPSQMHRGLSMEMSSIKAGFALCYRSSACNIRCVSGNENIIINNYSY